MPPHSEIGTGKTIIVLALVAACFTALWPKIFFPMFSTFFFKKGNSYSLHGCCDVMFETDINAIKIITEMCGTILNRQEENNPKLSQAFRQGKLTKEVVNACREEVMNLCGIDIAEFLRKNEKLGHSYKQMLDEIRSFNISVCLRHNFGINPGMLGAPRRMRIWGPSSSRHHRQERPLHFRPDMIHPALREKGRAIPHSQTASDVEERETSRPISTPGMRPTMGGAGHITAPKTGGVITFLMPIYTVGILVFFTYTLSKVFMKKTKENDELKDFHSDPEFRRAVFSEDCSNGCARRIEERLFSTGKQDTPHIWKSSSDDSTRLGLKERDTRDIEINHLKKRLEETEKAMERIVAQMESVSTELKTKTQIHLPKNPDKDKNKLEEIYTEEIKEVNRADLESSKHVYIKKEVQQAGNGQAGGHHHHSVVLENDDTKPKVKVMGLELMAECEDGRKWSRPATPNLGISSRSATPIPPSYSPEPQNIFLEGTLPQQSQLLVTDSKTQALTCPEGDEPEPSVILSSKMTLSLISLDTATPEDNFHQVEVHSLNQTEDNLGTADSTLLDVDSDMIDETGLNEYESSNIQEQEVLQLEPRSKEINEIMEESSSMNYTTATMSERAEAGIVAEIEDTAVDVSNLDGLDLSEDQLNLQEDFHSEDFLICNGSTRVIEELQGLESAETNDPQD